MSRGGVLDTRLPMSQSLAELLLRNGLVTPDGLAAARAEAARTHKRLAESVIDLGLVEERRLADAIARASDTSLVDPIPDDGAAAARHYIPNAIARELHVVPLRVLDDQLFVVMVNPLDREMIDVLHAVTTRTIRPMTGVRSEIGRLVSRFHRDDAAADDEEAPFHFSNETLLHRPAGLDFLRETMQPADEEFGTMIARPADRESVPVQPADEPHGIGEATAPTNPIVGVERRLDQIVGMIRNIERRLDGLESLLHDRGAVNR